MWGTSSSTAAAPTGRVRGRLGLVGLEGHGEDHSRAAPHRTSGGAVEGSKSGWSRFLRSASCNHVTQERLPRPPVFPGDRPTGSALCQAAPAARRPSGFRYPEPQPAAATSDSLTSHRRPAATGSCAAARRVAPAAPDEVPATDRRHVGRGGEVHGRPGASLGGQDHRLDEPHPEREHPAGVPVHANPVATVPGCRQLAVTPHPFRRRASSVVKRILASLEAPYTCMPR